MSSGPWIFLLRHGQIEGHETRRFIGRTDIPLDETGKAQALFWKNAFADIQFDNIYSSSLFRCRQTAALIRPDQEICVDVRLNEINLGDWDGKSFDHIKKTEPRLFQLRGENIDGFRPPGGESFRDLYDRVFPFFEYMGQDLKKPVLVVTHSGVIRVMLCHWLGRNPGQVLEIRPEYSHLFLLENR